MNLTLHAKAKINIGLRIVGRRDDGYHLIHTLFQEIDFHDRVTLATQVAGEITLAVTGPAAEGIPNDSCNLCFQAVKLFRQASGQEQGVHIQLEKHIPLGTGLGGGSSDAAAVLKGLNQLWQIGMTPEQLMDLAAELGADVPFFIRGGLQLGEGIGEQLTALERNLLYSIVLVIPPFGVDTPWAYQQFANGQAFSMSPYLDHLIHLNPIPWKAFTNDFESVVFPHYPNLAEIKKNLLTAGALHAGLSGSGSAMYGLFEEAPAEKELESRFDQNQVVVCRAVPGN